MNSVIRGMTWNHTRGYLPMVALAQRYQEIHPEFEIAWERRSLEDFEAYPVEDLAEKYDLLVIDHPFIGKAVESGVFLPLDNYLSSDFLREQYANSVGRSHLSYLWEDHQWALAIDAAAQVAVWREDIFAVENLSLPENWEDVLSLARDGWVGISAVHVHGFLCFLTFCLSLGEEPCSTDDFVASEDIGALALEMLEQLVSLLPSFCMTDNPIQIHERMAAETNRRLAYCPCTFGYYNYARDGYAAHPLTFGSPPLLHGTRMSTVLGGTGLALTAKSGEPSSQVLDFLQFAAAPRIQRTLHTWSGGQPGHRSAWLDAPTNGLCRQAFSRTLPAVEHAWLRPRYSGYMGFQKVGSHLVSDYLRGALTRKDCLGKMNEAYLRSRGLMS